MGGENAGLFAATLAEVLTEPDVEVGAMLDEFRATLRSRSGGSLSARRFGRLTPTPAFIAETDSADAAPQTWGIWTPRKASAWPNWRGKGTPDPNLVSPRCKATLTIRAMTRKPLWPN
ncbi:hypothetical protein [Sulfitobacter profundi]|uniref:Uncharacterized protein n=1 Tax=Sulfitobacter profundi TaxID=2679961 RepID=A0ABW1YTK8_9RHOB